MLTNKDLEKEGFIFRSTSLRPLAYWDHSATGPFGIIRYKAATRMVDTEQGELMAVVHVGFPSGYAIAEDLPANLQRLKLILIALLPPSHFEPKPAPPVGNELVDDDF